MPTKEQVINYLINRGHNPDEVREIVNRNYSGYIERFLKNEVTDLKRIARAIFLG